jgi:hypothetical protein
MQMKWLTFLLILLLISAQIDDVWAVVLDLPSAPLDDDNDEYLPAPRQLRGDQSSSRQQPVLGALKPRTADFPLAPGSVPSERNLTTPVAPPILYVFMSMQI